MALFKSSPKLPVIEKAIEYGASLAGITSIGRLKKAPYYRSSGKLMLPKNAKSILVLALAHSVEELELDWWERGRSSPGNRKLEALAHDLMEWLKANLQVDAGLLPYQVPGGGIYLKDAAVLAGLGSIGMNNLLITPEFGPRARLRALWIGKKLTVTEADQFSPCQACNAPCRDSCPQNAFSTGAYDKSRCMVQMRLDEADAAVAEDNSMSGLLSGTIKYCRVCEHACPVGRQ